MVPFSREDVAELYALEQGRPAYRVHKGKNQQKNGINYNGHEKNL
jgi:hypothetical protein